MTTVHANSSCSSSKPGARPTKRRSPVESACLRFCFLKGAPKPEGLRRGASKGGAEAKPMPMNVIYRGSADLPEIIPVFPLAGALLLPRGQLPLNIFEPRYLAMVDDSMRDGHRLIGMIQPDPSHPDPEDKPALFRVGCVGRITQLAEAGDGRYILELTGIARFKVREEIAGE